MYVFEVSDITVSEGVIVELNWIKRNLKFALAAWSSGYVSAYPLGDWSYRSRDRTPPPGYWVVVLIEKILFNFINL
jgi:hypothetical protein